MGPQRRRDRPRRRDENAIWKHGGWSYERPDGRYDRHLAAPALSGKTAPILVVAGSGFLGSNLADSFLRDGEHVIVLDNLSRPGVERNLEWLVDATGRAVEALIADIRDLGAIEPAFREAKAVFHFAARRRLPPASSSRRTISRRMPAARSTCSKPHAWPGACAVIFASTTRSMARSAHGDAGDAGPLQPADEATREHGVGEAQPLDFCTPYGCSKGVADQYVLDYARSFGLPTAVLRMSCVYGPRQFGTEDQAGSPISSFAHSPASLFRSMGRKQVRDILHVTDAVAAYRALLNSIDRLKGRAFNLGGGPANAVSIMDVLSEIELLTGRTLSKAKSDWRAGDQLYFVADTRAIADAAWLEGRNALARGLARPLRLASRRSAVRSAGSGANRGGSPHEPSRRFRRSI